MKNKLKKKLKASMLDLCSELDTIISTDRYEPSERGAGTQTGEQQAIEAEELVQKFIIETLKEFGIEESFEDLTFDEILKELKEGGTIADDYNELWEIEVKRDAEREPKYTYVSTFYNHIKEKRIIEVCEQMYNGESTDSIEYNEVKKTERIVYDYSDVKN